MAAQFFSRQPTTEEYWRAIILFGRNVASYKFALAKALLQLKPAAGTLVKLEDLAEPFALHVAQHLRAARQGQFQKSRFLDACKAFNEGKLNRDGLVEQTVRFGFNNVIDAFHVVGRDPVAERFFHDERGENAGIRLTDRFSMLIEAEQRRIWAHANRPKDRYYHFWNYFSAFVVPSPAHLDEIEGVLIASMPTENGAIRRIKRIHLPTPIARLLHEHRIKL